MKKILLLSVLFLAACGQPPDFSKVLKVESKIIDGKDVTYVIKNTYGNKGMTGAGWGSVKFSAPEDFAKVGQYIIYQEGKLFAVDNKPRKNKVGEMIWH